MFDKDPRNFILKEIKRYKRENIYFGKTFEIVKKQHSDIPSERILKNILIEGKNLEFAEIQEISKETRYTLYFVFSEKNGIRYSLTFRDKKVRIITVHKIGKRTLKKYYKKRFKKLGGIKKIWGII
ncbi:hypothetical protein HOC13_04550 [Candidatus Woesearchaeota archaeon]|jgi:hypothetical protein|nr:hypothetical protein [Candidatus Woesearchaeota archaeon]